MHVIWSKIRHLFECLKLYDAVAVFDNDAFITQFDVTIEDLLARHMSDPNMLMAMPEDCALARCYSPGKPATWFILAKSAAINAVHTWLTDAREKCNHIANVHPFDQLVLWQCVMEDPRFAGSVGVLPQSVIPTIASLDEGVAAMGIGGQAQINFKDGSKKLIPMAEFGMHCVDAAKQVDATTGIIRLSQIVLEHQVAVDQQSLLRSWREIKADHSVMLPFKRPDDLVMP
jgi:hypothetical protein